MANMEHMVFFDIDGTLLDFKTAERRGVEVLYERYEANLSLTGEGFYQAWCAVGERHFQRYLAGDKSFTQQKCDRVKDLWALSNIEVSDGDALRIFEVYLEAFEAHWVAFGDVLPCLEQLKSRYRLGIIRNGDGQQQTAKLTRLGIREAFEVIVTSGDVGVSKPAPEIFLKACRRAHVSPEESTYVGDSLETDILPAVRVGMHGVWIARHEAVPAANPSVMTIRSLEDLTERLKAEDNP